MVDVSTSPNNKNGGSMICLLPGASATGRDFLLEQLIAHSETVGNQLGLGRPLNIHVVKKTTTRPSRSTELLKICVGEDEFKKGLAKREIIAAYTLESNGHLYGYHRSSFDAPHDGVDLMISDASVYQIPELKQEFGDRIFTSAMIASRQYREANLRSRASESEEEIINRLNLGDGHVAIAIMMAEDQGVSYHDFVPPGFAQMITDLTKGVLKRTDTTKVEREIESYTRSKTVVKVIKQLAKRPAKYIDHLAVLRDEHRVAPSATTPMPKTAFFAMGVNVLQNALKSTHQTA